MDCCWNHGLSHSWNRFIENSLDYNFSDKGKNLLIDQKHPLLTIYFSHDMKDINRQTFRVYIEFPPVTKNGQIFWLTGVNFKLGVYGYIVKLKRELANGTVKEKLITEHTMEEAFAWAFYPHKNFYVTYFIFSLLMGRAARGSLGSEDKPEILGNEDNDLLLPMVHVHLKGDFIWSDINSNGMFYEDEVLDADNIGGQVGINKSHSGIIKGGINPSGNLTQGGDFESWFSLTDYEFPIKEKELIDELKTKSTIFNFMPKDGLFLSNNLNKITPDKLIKMPWVNANNYSKIIKERRRKQFKDLEEVRKRLELDDKTFNLMRTYITVEKEK